MALFDYAAYNEQILGNRSIIFYNRKSASNVDSVVSKFSARFTVMPYDNFCEVDGFIDAVRADLFYAIKCGNIDHVISKKVPSMIHAVFGQSLLDVHGSSYAYVSEWLSKKYSFGIIPFVPHIVVPPTGPFSSSFRKRLNIPSEAIVFGGYGGSESFDISFVREDSIPKILGNSENIYFIFMNFKPFIDHPRVKFLPRAIINADKQEFVNACDAMIHARSLGESFGLACSEFSAQYKPIFSYRFSADRCHHQVLHDSIVLYSDSADLVGRILSFRKDHNINIVAGKYLNFSPEYVMERFDRYFIHPALSASRAQISYSFYYSAQRKYFSMLSKAWISLAKRFVSGFTRRLPMWHKRQHL